MRSLVLIFAFISDWDTAIATPGRSFLGSGRGPVLGPPPHSIEPLVVCAHAQAPYPRIWWCILYADEGWLVAKLATSDG